MTRLDLEALVALCGGDRDLVDRLFDEGILVRCDEGYGPDEADSARVARTLVRDLDVNWEGVEIILRMRAEMLDMHRRVAELIALFRSTRP